MSGRIRYQAQSVVSEQAGVTAYSGVDPVTGLPVLIYRFRGTPDPALARLDSEYLPRLLAWRDDGDSGVMVVAWSSALVPAKAADLDNARLLDAARALADAAAAGLTHGDLTPARFMLAGNSVVLEGFGVPWHSGASTAADVRAWAGSVLELGYRAHDGVKALLEDIAAGSSQPAAAELLEQLRDLLLRSEPAAGAGPAPAAATAQPGAATEEAAGFEPLELSWDDGDAGEHRNAFSGSASQLPEVEEIELDYDPQAAQAAADPSDDSAELLLTDSQHDGNADAAFVPSETYASERLTDRHAAAAEQSPEPVTAEPAEQPPRRQVPAARLPAAGSTPVTDRRAAAAQASRSGGTVLPEAQGGERSSHRLVMIVALLVLSAVLAVLVLYLRRGDMDQVQPQAQQAITYVIDVLVEPGNLPPVNLYVLQSPADSQFTDGTILGTAPRRIALDAEGTWVFEGRFQGRVSDSVTISIPEDRSSAVTITIPPPEAASED